MNQHLDPQQFYHLLDPDLLYPHHLDCRNTMRSSELLQSTQHLQTCPVCRLQLESVRDSLTNFSIAATRLSLAQAPTRLLDHSSAKSRFFTLPRAAWASGLVAAMALGTVSLSMLHQPPATPAPSVQRSAAAPETKTQSDDALLNGIDSDLSTSVPPSLQPLEANPASEETASSSNN